MSHADSRGKAPTPMTYRDALQVVLELGQSDLSGDEHVADAPDQDEQRLWQREALDTLASIIWNNAEELSALRPAGRGCSKAALGVDRSFDPSDPLNAVRIALELARRAAGNPNGPFAALFEAEIDEEQRALGMVADLVGSHGDRIAGMTAPRVPGP